MGHVEDTKGEMTGINRVWRSGIKYSCLKVLYKVRLILTMGPK
jgi:hypothetical protein